MAFKFRKRIKIAPGITFNLGKKGVSATVGGKGASVNVGKNGTYLNTSIPGTGLSNRQRLDQPNKQNVQQEDDKFDWRPPKLDEGVTFADLGGAEKCAWICTLAFWAILCLIQLVIVLISFSWDLAKLAFLGFLLYLLFKIF